MERPFACDMPLTLLTIDELLGNSLLLTLMIDVVVLPSLNLRLPEYLGYSNTFDS